MTKRKPIVLFEEMIAAWMGEQSALEPMRQHRYTGREFAATSKAKTVE